MRILVVEDDEILASAIAEGLRDSAYEVDIAHDGEEAIFKVDVEQAYDLIILDIMLPKLDGLQVCERLRFKGNDTPILMLTVLDSVEDVVKGLDAGADDYLTKPFQLKELLARIRALLRRGRVSHSPVLRCGDLVLKPATFEVTREGTKIPLSREEFEILEYLLRNKCRVVSKKELEEHVWDEEGQPWSDVLRAHIKNLRKKCDRPFRVKLIKTVRGVGYEICDH
ncbi:MAG: hypothetical protein PWP37_81 [Thermotogota bacterium]|nr:hypothetical protein [Thermotogota bacterium]